jgi:hypothetical protein
MNLSILLFWPLYRVGLQNEERADIKRLRQDAEGHTLMVRVQPWNSCMFLPRMITNVGTRLGTLVSFILLNLYCCGQDTFLALSITTFITKCGIAGWCFSSWSYQEY